jgi:2'-5' RNA ligase
MRLFISIELPDDVKKKIKSILDELAKCDPKIKWVSTENLHITLKFIGEVKEEKVEEIIQRVRDSIRTQSSFTASFSELGTFPGGKYPRVVWLGIEKGKDEISGIVANIDTSLSDMGIEKEKREFTSHITLGRVKEKRANKLLIDKIEKLSLPDLDEIKVDKISIMQSKLTPKGPIYSVLKEVSF